MPGHPVMVFSSMPYFVLHEHHSKKLHYDLRLEMGGVLKSWAVPKGPSMSPADKRLAIMVKDHPIEYGTFEGIIPQGYYGAGPVVIWDSGEYDLVDADMHRGRVEFVLRGSKLKGAFTLVRFKGKPMDWLLIKKQDKYAVQTYDIDPELNGSKSVKLYVRVPPCDTD
jgi:bifunctional non-homologous end joining protein LigD